MPQSEPLVLIVGAGPVGLSLALGLARHGVRSRIVEADASISERSRAPGIHARTMEVFRQWGVADRVDDRAIHLPTLVPRTAGSLAPILRIPLAELDDECAFAGLRVLEQGSTERILLEAVRETGQCEVCFGHRLIALRQDDGGVHAVVRRASAVRTYRAPYLVGCDGADSTVRKLLGMRFPGKTYPIDAVLADVDVPALDPATPFPIIAQDQGHVMFTVRLETGAWRLVVLDPTESRVRDPAAPVDDRLIEDVVGTLLGRIPYRTTWKSRFRIHCRTAPRFRVGRVFLAGDAAHVNSPAGAQGMNAGVHDAHNLAWKLAAMLAGGDAERLASSYDLERRTLITRHVQPATDRGTRAIAARGWMRGVGLAAVGIALRVPAVRRRAMRAMSMLDGRYPASPLLLGRRAPTGTRIPDVRLRRGDERDRLHTLLGLRPGLVCVHAEPLPLPDAGGVVPVRIGEGGWTDPSGILSRVVGRGKLVVVRPDHVMSAVLPANGDGVRQARLALAEMVPAAFPTGPSR
jgi:2-polyprenyl-6-methoxyphenol hydroxylase-like FAD-dependent oxidoreductase